MNAPMFPGVMLQINEHGVDPSLATASVFRYVGASRYGEFLIEFVGDQIFVNGRRVERTRRLPPSFSAGVLTDPSPQLSIPVRVK